MIGFTMGGTPPPALQLTPETTNTSDCCNTGGCGCADSSAPDTNPHDTEPTRPSEEDIKAILDNNAAVRAKFGLPQKNNFANNDVVNVQVREGPAITGVIKGKSAVDVFDVYIVQIDRKDHPADLNYPFDCITIPEQALVLQTNTAPTLTLAND